MVPHAFFVEYLSSVGRLLVEAVSLFENVVHFLICIVSFGHTIEEPAASQPSLIRWGAAPKLDEA